MSAAEPTQACPVCARDIPISDFRIHARLGGSCAAAASVDIICSGAAAGSQVRSDLLHEEPPPWAAGVSHEPGQDRSCQLEDEAPPVVVDTDPLQAETSSPGNAGDSLNLIAPLLHPRNNLDNYSTSSKEALWMLDADAFLINRLSGGLLRMVLRE